MVGKDALQPAQRAVEVHRHRIGHQLARHLFNVGSSLVAHRASPFVRRLFPAIHALDHHRQHALDVADQRGIDGLVAIHFLRINVDLDELLRMRLTPLLALAVAEQPVEACANQHDAIALLQHQRAGSTSILRMVIGQQALCH
jgi:hypothetical protein